MVVSWRSSSLYLVFNLIHYGIEAGMELLLNQLSAYQELCTGFHTVFDYTCVKTHKLQSSSRSTAKPLVFVSVRMNSNLPIPCV